jgi:hypothetical protein
MYKYQIIFYLSIVLIIFSCNKLKKPEIFLDNNISTQDGFELCSSMTSDGKTLFYCKVRDYYRSPFNIFKSELVDGNWSTPERMPFNGRFSNYNPFISPYGNKLFFTSNRPTKKGELKNDNDIWYVEKKGTLWGEPIRLSDNINSLFNQFGPTMDKDENLYYSTMTPDTFGLHDIYYSKRIGDDYTKPINLGVNINTSTNDYDPAISYDGRILVFSRDGDLYVSYYKNNEWSIADKLGSNINTCATEFKPFISYDKKYLYYTGTYRGSGDIYRITLKDAGIKTNL